VPYIPLGQYFQPTAYRRRLVGMRRGFAQFYNIRQG
jgi:peptide/nickel transport system substrate-binding protein